MITTCCICGNELRTAFSQSNEDILGMAHEYTQKIGICDACGFIVTQNPFSEEQLANRYKMESKFEYDAEGGHIFDATSEYAKRSRTQKSFIADNTDNIQSMLEIGASSGYNLSLYDEISTRVGIEPSLANCVSAKKKYGVDMFCGTYQEYERQNSFDLIFLSMVLEHIVDPYSFIEWCRVRNNKYIFIEVPLLDHKLLNEPFGMFGEEHVNYFTYEGLYNLMRTAGYGLVNARLEYNPHERIPAGWPGIDTIWEKGRFAEAIFPVISSVQILDHYIEANKKQLRKIQEKIHQIPNDVRLAVWGTGHHVSMLLVNTELGKKNIVKFYDSDARKHKYTMHGKSIGAFSPEDLVENRIEAVLIGTYVFQNVISTIINPYSEKVQVYTLY